MGPVQRIRRRARRGGHPVWRVCAVCRHRAGDHCVPGAVSHSDGAEPTRVQRRCDGAGGGDWQRRHGVDLTGAVCCAGQQCVGTGCAVCAAVYHWLDAVFVLRGAALFYVVLKEDGQSAKGAYAGYGRVDDVDHADLCLVHW